MCSNDFIKKLDEEKDQLIATQIQNHDCPDKKLGQEILSRKNKIDKLLNNEKAED